MKKAIIIVSVIAALWALTYLFNDTPFLYNTPSAYADAANIELISPEYGPIYSANPQSDRAIIFLAGYTATPAQFLYIKDQFKKDFNVIAPLYPGCGTDPDKFVKTFYTQWYAKSRDAYLEARKKFKQVYVCGFSMGGTIALRLAEEYSADPALRPDAVISISGPVFFNNLVEEGVLYDWRLYFVRYMSWFKSRLSKPHNIDFTAAPEPETYDTADYLKQVYSLTMGMREAKQGLKKITVPLLVMQAKGDTIVPYQNLSYIAKHVSSAMIKERAFDLSAKEYDAHTRHFIPHYPGTRDEVIAEIKAFLK